MSGVVVRPRSIPARGNRYWPTIARPASASSLQWIVVRPHLVCGASPITGLAVIDDLHDRDLLGRQLKNRSVGGHALFRNPANYYQRIISIERESFNGLPSPT